MTSGHTGPTDVIFLCVIYPVTGLDISDSIAADDMRLELEGMTLAIRSPEVIATLAAPARPVKPSRGTPHDRRPKRRNSVASRPLKAPNVPKVAQANSL